MDEGQDSDEAVVTVEIPAALADRIDRLYADCRGYQPSSLQESLSVLCDLASGRLDPHPPETAGQDARGPAAEVVTDPTETESGERDVDVVNGPSPRGPAAETQGDGVGGGTGGGDGPSGGGDGPNGGGDVPSGAVTGDRHERHPGGADGTTDAGTVTTGAASEFDGPHGTGERDERIDEAFPARWSAAAPVRRQVRAVVDHFVRDPAESSGYEEREAAALAAAAAREDRTPEALHDELVAALYGNAGLPDDLAAEFFSEALVSVIEMDTPEAGFGGVADGAMRDRPGEDAFAVGTLETEDAFDVDTLLGDVSQPMADCERCGETHPVNDLETVLGSKTATIELLCGDCASSAE
ncbi:hypothetical protein [Haloarchaeobius sp. HME9146]|uniref:hypothetical protein n=1 Tax=Haloarchaeobius sp. HME9146 TaxID=2978732 RepID=UPI0021C1E52F|nr:hypothetical protein [Haloarchaeobius sp. HME9146]MCT9095504.1 hypothetical protein [Haloarchaeobius sp. HME9146]